MNYDYLSTRDKTLKIFYVCEKEYSYFLNKSNVVGIGFGYKFKNGFYTKIKCIKVFVTRKLPSNRIPLKDLVPKRYKGIETDVVAGGKFTPQSLKDRIRPVLCGYSVGAAPMVSGGSVGCLVTDGTSRYMLSNNHVFANFNSFDLGTKILQPSVKNGGKVATDVVATLAKYIELKRITAFRRRDNYADCAIGKLVDDSIASPSIALIGMPKGPKAPTVGVEVKKAGATTGLTTGTITSIKATYEADYGSRSVLFKNQIITSYMTMEGDSGSVLVDSSNHVLGLTLGGTNTYTVFNSIGDVLRLLGVTIVTG